MRFGKERCSQASTHFKSAVTLFSPCPQSNLGTCCDWCRLMLKTPCEKNRQIVICQHTDIFLSLDLHVFLATHQPAGIYRHLQRTLRQCCCLHHRCRHRRCCVVQSHGHAHTLDCHSRLGTPSSGHDVPRHVHRECVGLPTGDVIDDGERSLVLMIPIQWAIQLVPCSGHPEAATDVK
jgi:hypothetical protein